MEFFNRIHSKYTGIKGFLTVYNDALRYRYMLTEKAKYKAKALIFWGKHGFEVTLDACPSQGFTLYSWKKRWEAGGKKIEALNEKSRVPRTRRKRLWPSEVIREIKQLRQAYPNLSPMLRAIQPNHPRGIHRLPCLRTHGSGCLQPHIDWLIWYNTERVHSVFQNKLSPVQFMISLPRSAQEKLPAECKSGWPHTRACFFY
jgi:hypothetical protein